MVSAADSVATFLNGAVNRAERHQQPVELVISRKEGTLMLVLQRARLQRGSSKCRTASSIEAVLPVEEGIDPSTRAVSSSFPAPPFPVSASN